MLRICALVIASAIFCFSQAGEPLAVGSAAPQLGAKKTYNVPAGKVLDLPSLKGHVVVVDFWATWCGPCVAAIPHMQQLWDKYKTKEVAVIGHTDGSSENLPEFIKAKGITYPISVGTDIGNAYGVSGIPHVFVIGHDGKILWHGHPAELKDEVIDQALAKVPAKTK